MRKVGLALLGLILGIVSPTLAGTAPEPPSDGGGGGSKGEGVANVFTGSSWESSWASGSVSGPLVTQGMGVNVSTYANPDPKPGDIGTFNLGVWAYGMFYEPGDPAPNPQGPRANAYLRTNEVHPEPGKDGGETIFFDQTLLLDARGNSGFWIDPDSGNYNGWLVGNFNVDGGAFTDVYASFSQNEWTGSDPPPSWFHEWDAFISASGVITSPTFTIVPEPATLGMAALGGAAAFWRRRKSRERNLIA